MNDKQLQTVEQVRRFRRGDVLRTADIAFGQMESALSDRGIPT